MDYKKQILTEIQHRLNNQYEVSKYIADEIYNVLGKQNNITVDISKFNCDITHVNVIIKSSFLKNTSASITGIKPVEITVNIYSLWDFLNKDWLITDIQNAVSHELMHANIFTNTYNTYKDCGNIDFIRDKINTQPEWYQDVINGLKQVDIGSDERNFLYMMYTCYYHEKQAFVAQADTQIKKLLFTNKINRISYDNAAQILNNVDNYNIFIRNIELCDKILQFNPFEQVEFSKKINVFLNEKNRLSYDDFIKLVKYCRKSSLSAIKLIENILVTDFYEINDK